MVQVLVHIFVSTHMITVSEHITMAFQMLPPAPVVGGSKNKETQKHNMQINQGCSLMLIALQCNGGMQMR